MSSRRINRRDFLRYVGVGSATVLLGGFPATHAIAHSSADASPPDVWIELTAAPQAVALRPGPATNVWSYHARVLEGDPSSVQAWPGGYLGPILRVARGQRLRVDFVNHIDKPTIVNWHGLHVPANMMGLPRYEIQPGGRYRYEFAVTDRAGSYWYHAMAAGHTPEQVYFGLAGLLTITDAEEQALHLPSDEFDVPVVIQDRNWSDDNQFVYLPDTGPRAARAGHVEVSERHADDDMMGGMMGGRGGMGSMMTRMMGFFGNHILVNGHPDASLKVATHAYRLRVVNASNSRTYKLGWSDGRPVTVMATGGGLLERPLTKPYVMLTPGQHIELWEDFSRDAVGTQRTLVSLPFHGSMGMMDRMDGGMMGRMMHHQGLADGAAFPILKVTVEHQVKAGPALPQQLSTITRLQAADAINHAHPRIFRVTMAHMQWGFNGHSFEMDHTVPNEVVKLGTTEIWEFRNSHMMAHAIHLHGLQFQVLGRSNSPRSDDVTKGYVDEGWRDTVLLMPGETVRLIMRFADFTGTYAYQCHMLEHAADGLMRNYVVKA
ncbi:MAG TPA: multicopper oxidase family protein [Nevskiaceae bacterium]|nr:multicopper oxidase family protein [Nevskiaceae bacterium]